LDFDPNDPFLTSAGSWSQPYADLWGLERIGALEAWQMTRGAGQVVAVVDTGLDYEHPDIAANVWVNPGEDLDHNGRVDPSDFNGIDDDDNGFIDDIRGYDFAGYGDVLADGTVRLGDPDPFDDIGHGTHVAGIIAATADNGIGIAGVAPEALIMPLKGFASDGTGRDTDLWRSVLYAIENGADVINASWSCSPSCPENPLAREVLAIAEEVGVVFVTSAGNRSFDVIRNAPENSEAAITVGSVGFDDLLSHFSNRGWLLDLLAPGGGPSTPASVFVPRRNILSLAATSLPETEEIFIVEGAYWRQSGTSMAAPYVAGAVALLRAVRGELDVTEIRRLLRIAAEDLGPIGHDPTHGAGLLDLPALLSTPLPDLELSIRAPGPGQILDPNEGPVELVLVANGKDLSSYSIAYSRGLETSEFEEIRSGDSLDGVAVVPWPVDDLSDGPYVLRLRATLHGGRVVDEFGILALERNRPQRLSTDDDDESQPSISGRKVVWRGLVEGSRIVGEIRAGGFGHAGSRLPTATISASSEAQRSPIVSGHRVSWLEAVGAAGDDIVRGCRISRRAGMPCQSRTLVEGQGRLVQLAFARGRLLWSPWINDVLHVLGCVWRSADHCETTELTQVDDSAMLLSRRLIDFDGYTAIWSVAAPQSPIQICTNVLDGVPCLPRTVTIDGGSPLTASRVSLDGSLLAFEIDRGEIAFLAYCQLDLETAVCRDPQVIETVGAGREPDVSGRRIVWTETIEGEPDSIAFCEVDPVEGDCVRQRLSGSVMPAGVPKLDGGRVVWEDRRVGPNQIFGLELPSIRVPFEMRPGRIRFIPIEAPDPGTGRLLALELEGVSGPSPEMLGASIVPINARWAGIVIDAPVHSGVGPAIWRIRGMGRGGLETQRLLEIPILPSYDSGRDRAHGSAGVVSRSNR